MLLRLKNRQSERTQRYRALLAPFASKNAFNPSFQRDGNLLFIAFRHLGKSGVPPFEASLLICDLERGVQEHLNLSRQADRYGIPVVADPKLVLLDGQLWVTFNSGFSGVGNQLFLARLSPELGPPMECVLEDRQTVEKNWSFFVDAGCLKAIYSVDPLRMLTAGLPGDGDRTIVFTDEPIPAADMPNGDRPKIGLTIGTQAISWNGDLFLVAHERWYVKRKRAYLGRCVRLRRSAENCELEVSNTRLCYSLRTLLGSRERYNKNLFSCTYFSGLAIEDGRVILGYGINDLSFGFSEAELSAL